MRLIPCSAVCWPAINRSGRWRSLTGQGLAACYNQALPHCDGDYVAFVGSDVAITDGNWLSALLEYCQTARYRDRSAGGLLSDTLRTRRAQSPIPDIDNHSAWYYARYLQQASVLLNGRHCPQNIWSAGLGVLCGQQRGPGCAAAVSPLTGSPISLPSMIFLSSFLSGVFISTIPRIARWNGGRIAAVSDRKAARSLGCRETGLPGEWRQNLLQGDPFFNRGRLQEEIDPACKISRPGLPAAIQRERSFGSG